jgi:hypothetical protein
VIRSARSFALLSLVPLLAACELPFGACTSELRPNLVVEVPDAVTGASLAAGATGSAVHEDGDVTELAFMWDTVALHGSWSRERKGRYTVRVRKPGYEEVVREARVSSDACHVRTARVDVRLRRDARQVLVAPADLRLDAHVQGWRPSAAVRVDGRTLEVTGMALAPCSDLRAVAYRSDYPTMTTWHIQIEPEVWSVLGGCREQAIMQPFTATFTLAPGANWVRVTTGLGFPTLHFEGALQGS